VRRVAPWPVPTPLPLRGIPSFGRERAPAQAREHIRGTSTKPLINTHERQLSVRKCNCRRLAFVIVIDHGFKNWPRCMRCGAPPRSMRRTFGV